MPNHQKIGCKVSQCAFHKNDYCMLDSIMVCPGAKADSPNPAEASMCASFRKQRS
ncbi:MAG TPA: DUF1540 domain-containing protein [Clostridia bacterium]|nr:DUF1540 domain-containing protein [Clostridia bacterium]